MEFLNNTRVLITGGTGSFGSTFLKSILMNSDAKEIRIFSRDESKQDSLRQSLSDRRLRFFLGDVRDTSSMYGVFQEVDFVFHAAALKQVPSSEFFPIQAVNTNILGSENVFRESIENGVQKVVALSTDKAAYPVNAMGMTKALMEKTVQSLSRLEANSKTTLTITRYGNVMMSRGSVIPIFMQQISQGKPISITNPKMTRFLMSLEESVNLVLHALQHGDKGDLFVKKSPAANLEDLAEGVAMAVGKSNHPVEIIGGRHGEKLHETLLGSEDMRRVQESSEHFRVPLDMRSLDFFQWSNSIASMKPESQLDHEYTSSNSIQLSPQQIAEKLEANVEFCALRNSLFVQQHK